MGPGWPRDRVLHDGDIFVLDLGTGALLRLTKTPVLFESYPDWSPDGEEIAYELNDESPPGQPNQEYDAYVMRADGTDARRLSRPGDVDGHPVWSPGGRLIAYGSDVGPEIGDGIAIVIVDAGSGTRSGASVPPEWTSTRSTGRPSSSGQLAVVGDQTYGVVVVTELKPRRSRIGRLSLDASTSTKRKPRSAARLARCATVAR